MDSPSRVLRLVIGTENFPTWLIEKMNAGANTREAVTVRVSERPSITPSNTNQPQISKSTSVEVLLKDLDGTIVSDSDILIDGNEFKTDSNCRIKLDSLDVGEHKVVFNGETKTISVVKGDSSFVVYYTQTINKSDNASLSPAYYVIIGIAVVATLIIGFKVLKKR